MGSENGTRPEDRRAEFESTNEQGRAMPRPIGENR